MHGVVFTSYRDYLTAEFGDAVAADVLAGEPSYLLSEAYDDSRLANLIERSTERTGRDADSLLFDFGVFTAQRTFARLYPAFFDVAPSAREFLLTVETRIHELVRATIPNAAPPELRVFENGDDGVSILYTSPRRLCVLLRGLTEGTARHYGQTAAIEESACMRRGDEACRFDVQLSAAEA